ncbi:hypothetical protein QPL79_07990 [Ignisphaera sp. 4213-co]|uniref:Uncharacterized protein n=1 Tax=Ignisphaera cupida TaxID=3050454 RepID=A0ABD4Z7W9_9CREN|nr:hypothetical protein [Ignisphaera sp. 4213-co]MDK6029300.1 hypothetical protein [Ignisphaera sp. 4213-co]
MVLEKDLSKVLNILADSISTLGVNVNELKDSVKELEKSQQFLVSKKAVKILNKLHIEIFNLRNSIEKSETKDIINSISNVVRGISNYVKELGVEFKLTTQRSLLFLAITILISMITSIASFSILYLLQIVNNLSFVTLTFIVLFTVLASFLSLHLKLLTTIILVPLTFIPSIITSIIGLALHTIFTPTIVIQLLFSTAILILLTIFLIQQISNYKDAINKVILIYNTINSLKTIIEDLTKKWKRLDHTIIDETIFTNVYGDEATELIKYTIDVSKVK